MERRPSFVLILLCVLLTVFASAAMAQGGCQTFRAIAEGQALSPNQGLNSPLLDIWGGTVYASLGTPGAKKSDIPLTGVFSGADADDYLTDVKERTFGGMGLHGAYTFAFGDPAQPWETYTDKFTVTLGRAIWNITPGLFVGDYQASGRISAGSGRFAMATGSITIHGPFFIGSDPPHWTPEIEGTVCSVQ